MTAASSTHAISPVAYDAVIFDLDGVVTDTARTHAAAWKQLFDDYLGARARQSGREFKPFDAKADYLRYVDGKPRYEGVRSFLGSRGIELPYGDPGDDPSRETICGLGNRKNDLFRARLEQDGVTVYDTTIALIAKLRERGIRTAIISSSRNCVAVLQAAGIAQLFDAKIDGIDAVERNIPGKPAPDVFLAAAEALQVNPARAVVVEDSIAGVQAGRAGGFGRIIGVDRGDQAEALRQSGADWVVKDMGEVSVAGEAGQLPSALERTDEILRQRGGTIALFLDYDGTLTPIVDEPGKAVLDDGMRAAVRRLAGRCTVAVVSGRDLADVRQRVGIDGIFYAGSHGFDIAGPDHVRAEYQEGADFLPVLDEAERKLGEYLRDIAGALIERKKFSIAVHYRKVAPDRVEAVEQAVDGVLRDHQELKGSSGKKVFELQPKVDWHKGKAVLWLLETLKLDRDDVLPLYIGDDVTDEDAFRALRERGVGIVVMESDRPTAARYALRDPPEVRKFLDAVTLRLSPEAR